MTAPGQGFTWSPAGFSDGTAALMNAYSIVRSELDELNKQLDLRLGSWTDSAKEAYTMNHAEWESSANNMNDALNTAAKTLVDTSDQYDSAERSARSKFA